MEKTIPSNYPIHSSKLIASNANRPHTTCTPPPPKPHLYADQMADPRVRQLTIKSGVLKRLTKEKIVYEKEVDQQRARMVKLLAAGKDEHTMRKEEECLQESLMMVPNTQRR